MDGSNWKTHESSKFNYGDDPWLSGMEEKNSCSQSQNFG